MHLYTVEYKATLKGLTVNPERLTSSIRRQRYSDYYLAGLKE